MSSVPLSLEALFAIPIVYDKRLDVGKMGSKYHTKEVPQIRCRIDDIIAQSINMPEDAPPRLWEIISDRFNWDWEDTQRWFKEEHKYEILFDNDGYNIQLDCPVFELLNQRREYEENIATGYRCMEKLMKDPCADRQELMDLHEHISECVGAIEDIDKAIVKCAPVIQEFIRVAESMKHSMDGVIVVVNDDGDYDIAYGDDIPDGYREVK